jgi:hypothetical protein
LRVSTANTGLVIAACLAFTCLPASASKRPSPKTANTHQDSVSYSSTPSHHSSSHTKKSSKKKATNTKFVPKQKVPTPDRITEIQSALSRGEYYKGDPSGKWDDDTVAAMQKFQSANGIEPTGKLDAPTLQKLGLGSDIAGVSAPRPLMPSSTQSVTPPDLLHTAPSSPSS